MKRKKAARRLEVVPVWTYQQTQKALPYFSALLRGIREHRIEAQRHHLVSKRFGKIPRPNRKAIIARDESLQEYRQADDLFQGAMQELNDLGVYCLDPIQGLALVPFAKEKQLAWFIYDLFDSQPIRFWRYHCDDLDVRRPIAELEQGPETKAVVA